MGARRLSATGRCIPLLALAALSATVPGRAQQALGFELEPTCPPEGYFWAEVSARLGQDADPKALLGAGVLRTTRDGPRYLGSLKLEGLEGRSVSGENCREVLSALALIAVLRIKEAETGLAGETAGPPLREASNVTDTVASTDDETSAADDSAATTAPSAPSVAGGRPPAPAPSSIHESNTFPTQHRAPSAPESARAPSRTASLRNPSKGSWANAGGWLLGVGGFVVTGPAPSPIGGPSISAEHIWSGAIPISIASGFEAGWSGKAETEVGRARFQWWVGRVAGCVEAVARGPVGIWPCADISGGLTEAIGIPGGQLDDGWREPQGWAAAGILAFGRLEVSPDWFVDLGGGAAIPLLRHKTVFRNPRSQVHETERFSLTGRVRLNWKLPE